MKQEVRSHLLTQFGVFFFISIFWLIQRSTPFDFVYLFFGMLWGSFFLELDHLIFWLYVKPNNEESRIAQAALKQKDVNSLLELYLKTESTHSKLIFHHYFFQSVLAVISFFIFTSTSGIFTKAFVLALNIHLVVEEIIDYSRDKKYLQNWLFAGEKKQISVDYLKHYILIFLLTTCLFVYILTRSNL
ncbi:MAG: hypothetical protein ACOX6N_00860 [Patescibacteria group bacterium]